MKSELLHYLGTCLPVKKDPGVIIIPWLRNTGLKLKTLDNSMALPICL